MTHCGRVMEQPDNTIHRQPSGIRTTAGGRSLPPEVLLSGVLRLRLLAYVLVAFMGIAFVMGTIVPRFIDTPWLNAADAMMFFRSLHEVQVAGIIGAAAMIAITYW